MQCFLDRCYKRKYTFKSFSIKHLLEKLDRKVFHKVSGIDRHPLRGLLPKKKESTYNLRNQTSQYPKVNTDRFKKTYINRLIFKYNLAMWAYFNCKWLIYTFYSNIVTWDMYFFQHLLLPLFSKGIQINLEGKSSSSWEVVSKGFFHASPHYVHTHLSILINIMLVTSSLQEQEDRTENKGAVLI